MSLILGLAQLASTWFFSAEIRPDRSGFDTTPFMERMGLSGGLPGLAEVLHRVALVGDAPLRDRSVTGANQLSLLADTALRSPMPSSPDDLFGLDSVVEADVVPAVAATPPDLGDMTMDELNEALVDSDFALLSDSLDAPWDVATSAGCDDVLATDDALSGTSALAPMEEDVSAAVSALLVTMVATVDEGSSPAGSFHEEVASTAGSPEAIPSPSPPLSPESIRRVVLAEDEEEKKEEPLDFYAVPALLAAAARVTKRPPFPPAPTHHPSAKWRNSFNPKAEVDTEEYYPIKKLIDRWGMPPHVAYLVEWAVKPCQLSWEWPENLTHVDYLMEQVDKWQAPNTTDSFNAFYRSNFRGALASATGLCFLDSFRTACYDLGVPKLVTIDHWNRFCAEYGKDLSNGVIHTDIAAFFEFLRRDRVGLDFLILETNQQNETISNIRLFGRFAQRYLDPGHYLVHAAQDLVEHCFTLVVSPPKGKFIKTLEVLDGYRDADDPPCFRELHTALDWLTQVYGIYPIVLKAPKKRKSKTAKKRAKRTRQD